MVHWLDCTCTRHAELLFSWLMLLGPSTYCSQVLLPYIKAKLDRLYKLHANQGLLGLALQHSARASEQQQAGVHSRVGACMWGAWPCLVLFHALDVPVSW